MKNNWTTLTGSQTGPQDGEGRVGEDEGDDRRVQLRRL